MKTDKEIYSSMKEIFTDKTGVSLRDDADMSVRLWALAHELGTLWTHSDWLRRQCFPQLAEGQYLDYHAQLRGIERGEAVAAVGVIRFSIASARQEPVAIGEGVVCLAPGEIEFCTTRGGAIPAGELYCDVSAVARRPGAAGNVARDCVIYMANPPAGVQSCRNPEAFSGGVDAERDGELRERVLGSYRRLPNGANAAYYETQALEVDGVCAVSVLPKRRGLGTVDVVISTESGMPNPALLDAVQTKLAAGREICVSIQTLAPTPKNISLSVAVKPADGFGADAVKSGVQDALRAHFGGRLLGQNVLLAQLGNIVYGVQGVLNYKIISPAADIGVEADELPVLQSAAISGMV